MALWIVLSVISITLFLINSTEIFFPSRKLPETQYPLMNFDTAEILPVGQSDKLIIMLHGFASSPATFNDYRKRFDKLGYDILIPRLPGCGTSPNDFIYTRYSHWYAYVKDLYVNYRRKYQNVHILGVSLGGTLALNLAEDFSSNPALCPSSITIAGTPVFLNSLFFNGVLKDFRLYFSGILALFIRYIPKPDSTNQHNKLPDNAKAWSGYHGFFPVQLHSLKINLKHVRRQLSQIQCPLYVTHAKKDRTVPFENLTEIISRTSSKKVLSRIFDLGKFPHTRHVLFIYDSTRHIIFKDLLAFFEETEIQSDNKRDKTISQNP